MYGEYITVRIGRPLVTTSGFLIAFQELKGWVREKGSGEEDGTILSLLAFLAMPLRACSK